MKTSYAIGSTLLLLMGYASSAQAQSGCVASPASKPDIVGVYSDNYNGLQAVLEKYWISGQLVFEICSVDNSKMRLIAWNGLRDPYNSGKFSRFDWIKFQNRLWYCQVVFDAISEAAADAAPAPDPSDPRTKGCGQFEWSSLIRVLP